MLVANILFQWLVQLVDPTLDTAQVERCVTLLAIPNGRALEHLILTDDALLVTSSQGLNIELALLGQVLELADKVFIVVLYFGLVSLRPLSLLVISEFFGSCKLIVVFGIVGGAAQVLGRFEALLFASSLDLVLVSQNVGVLTHFLLVDNLASFLVEFLVLVSLLFKVFSFFWAILPVPLLSGVLRFFLLTIVDRLGVLIVVRMIGLQICLLTTWVVTAATIPTTLTTVSSVSTLATAISTISTVSSLPAFATASTTVTAQWLIPNLSIPISVFALTLLLLAVLSPSTLVVLIVPVTIATLGPLTAAASLLMVFFMTSGGCLIKFLINFRN